MTCCELASKSLSVSAPHLVQRCRDVQVRTPCHFTRDVQVCSGAGTCLLDAGSCSCFSGYEGAFCERCANGFEREPHTALCLPVHNTCTASQPALAPAADVPVAEPLLASAPSIAVATAPSAGGADTALSGYGGGKRSSAGYGYGYGDGGYGSSAGSTETDTPGEPVDVPASDVAGGPLPASAPGPFQEDTGAPSAFGGAATARNRGASSFAAPEPAAFSGSVHNADLPAAAAWSSAGPEIAPEATSTDAVDPSVPLSARHNVAAMPGSSSDGGGIDGPAAAASDSAAIAPLPASTPADAPASECSSMREHTGGQVCYADSQCADGGICVGNLCICGACHDGAACEPHCAADADISASMAPGYAGDALCACCTSGVFDNAGQCCEWTTKRRPTLDARGKCCAAGYLDACGRCPDDGSPWGFAFDRDGACCEVCPLTVFVACWRKPLLVTRVLTTLALKACAGVGGVCG